MALTIEQIVESYGALNDIQVGSKKAYGDRRLTTVASALQAVLQNWYTSDALAGKNIFRGIVLASLPSQIPRRTSKAAYFEAIDIATESEAYVQPQLLWYYYKVYIPEIEPRCINFHLEPQKLLASILTLADTGMSTKLMASGMNKKLAPGTLVTVIFEDPVRAAGPEIIEVGPLIFPVDITGVQQASGFPAHAVPRLYKEAGDPRAADHTYSWPPQTNATVAPLVTTGESSMADEGVLECAQSYDRSVLSGPEVPWHRRLRWHRE